MPSSRHVPWTIQIRKWLPSARSSPLRTGGSWLHRMTSIHTIANCSERLASGSVSSRALLEECLGAIAAPSGEGTRTFLSVDASSARIDADAADKQRRSGAPLGSLSGIPVSVKDLFDVAGQITRAGSMILSDAAPAEQDAAVVAALRTAGAILVGRTNMTEFAFSGLGMNPHFGTRSIPTTAPTAASQEGRPRGQRFPVSDGMAVARNREATPAAPLEFPPLCAVSPASSRRRAASIKRECFRSPKASTP